jgi:phosphate acetyltransferase
MLSNKEIVCPNNLLDVAHKKKGVKAAIVKRR